MPEAAIARSAGGNEMTALLQRRAARGDNREQFSTAGPVRRTRVDQAFNRSLAVADCG